MMTTVTGTGSAARRRTDSMIQTHFVSWNKIRNVTISQVMADCATKCSMTLTPNLT
jgi:hypothetical protein